ncbi:MAG TPA: hypothetical protein VHF24_06925 [Acidimicrobiales bacterium]|nr:hypothetical protein [Acidimicrobiales bacterium]
MSRFPSRRGLRRERWRLLPLGLAAAVVLSGCATRYKSNVVPDCLNTDTLVLMAQSVPSAEMVPCIETTPAGWTFETIDIRDGHSFFALDSDRAGDRAVRVTLRRSCNVAGATEIVSDEPGTRRFERVESVLRAYRGVRTYQFPGGCVTYRFDFERRGLALVNEVSLAIGFASRQEVARQARLPSL